MRYHLFQKFFGKMVKIKETSFLSTRGIILMFGNCMNIFDSLAAPAQGVKRRGGGGGKSTKKTMKISKFQCSK